MSDRGHVPGLLSPHPIAAMLPAIYAGNPFLDGFLGALDEVVAPAMAVLDCLPAYVDPDLAPEDFLTWLAGWLGIELDDHWSVDRKRARLRQHVELLAIRGTPEGLRRLLELELPATVTLDEPGGVAVSVAPGAHAPGRDDGRVRVTLAVDDVATFDERSARALVRRTLPAHLVAELVVVERAP